MREEKIKQQQQKNMPPPDFSLTLRSLPRPSECVMSESRSVAIMPSIAGAGSMTDIAVVFLSGSRGGGALYRATCISCLA